MTPIERVRFIRDKAMEHSYRTGMMLSERLLVEYLEHFVFHIRMDPWVRANLERGLGVHQYQIHHILPKEIYPEFEFEEWNLVALASRSHASRQSDCALLWPYSGQPIAAELMAARYNIAISPEVIELAYQKKTSRSIWYDRQFTALVAGNPFKKGTQKYLTMGVILKRPGIHYQSILPIRQKEKTKVQPSVSKDINWLVAIKAIEFEEYDQRLFDYASNWIVTAHSLGTDWKGNTHTKENGEKFRMNMLIKARKRILEYAA